MHLGSQLRAAQGYHNLSPDQVYYFLWTHAPNGLVYLAKFSGDAKRNPSRSEPAFTPPSVQILRMESNDFRMGVRLGHITELP